MKRIRLLYQLEFIAAGTLLNRNVNGDYYIPRSDKAYMDSPIQYNTGFVISGGFIRDNPSLYTVEEGEVDCLSLLTSLRYAIIDDNPTEDLLSRLAQIQQQLRPPHDDS